MIATWKCVRVFQTNWWICKYHAAAFELKETVRKVGKIFLLMNINISQHSILICLLIHILRTGNTAIIKNYSNGLFLITTSQCNIVILRTCPLVILFRRPPCDAHLISIEKCLNWNVITSHRLLCNVVTPTMSILLFCTHNYNDIAKES